MQKLRAYLDEERGRASKLAAALNISPSAISMWQQVPEDKIRAVADLTGIAPADLRPDLADLFRGAPANEAAA